jgi:hypothetical protein
MKGLKGASSEAMCVGIRLFIELLSHRSLCYFFVVVFAASSDVRGRLVLCLRVVFMMVYGEGGLLS